MWIQAFIRVVERELTAAAYVFVLQNKLASFNNTKRSLSLGGRKFRLGPSYALDSWALLSKREQGDDIVWEGGSPGQKRRRGRRKRRRREDLLKACSISKLFYHFHIWESSMSFSS